MRLKIESYEYNRDHGSFSISAKEGEEDKLVKAIELICADDDIDGISADEYSADFVFCKSMFSDDCIRTFWKKIKKSL